MKYFIAKSALTGFVVMLTACSSKMPAPVVDRSQQPTSQPPVLVGLAAAVPAVERLAAKGFYIVKPGDNLYRVSLDHGHSHTDVAAWNKLESPYLIHPGQEIRISPPGGETQTDVVTRPVLMTTAVEQRPLEERNDGLKSGPKAGREEYSDAAYAKALKIEEAPVARIELKAEPAVVVKPDPGASGEPHWAWPSAGKPIMKFGENGKKGLELAGKRGDPILAAADGKVVYSGTALRGYGQLLIVKHNPVYLSVYAHNDKVYVKESDSVKRGQRIADMGDSEADQVKLYFEIREQGKQVDPAKLLPAR